MAIEAKPGPAPEICHSFVAGVRLHWELNQRAGAFLLYNGPFGPGTERAGLHNINSAASNAAALATIYYLGEFVGELTFEDEAGRHCYSPDQIDEYFRQRTAEVYSGQLDDWGNAHDASQYAAEKAGLFLTRLTAGADLSDEDRLRSLVRGRLPKEMSR